MTKPILVTNRSLLGNVAKWAVEQSPYHRPDNLEIVLDRLNELTEDDFKSYVIKFDTWREAEIWLKINLRQIPEFLDWNKRKNGDKRPYGVVTATSRPSPDNDFIDLDALYRNVINDISAENE